MQLQMDSSAYLVLQSEFGIDVFQGDVLVIRLPVALVVTIK